MRGETTREACYAKLLQIAISLVDLMKATKKGSLKGRGYSDPDAFWIKEGKIRETRKTKWQAVKGSTKQRLTTDGCISGVMRQGHECHKGEERVRPLYTTE